MAPDRLHCLVVHDREPTFLNTGLIIRSDAPLVARFGEEVLVFSGDVFWHAAQAWHRCGNVATGVAPLVRLNLALTPGLTLGLTH